VHYFQKWLLVWASSSKAKKNSRRQQEHLGGKWNCPNINYLICPNIFDHFVPNRLAQIFPNLAPSSGAARIPCAQGQNIFVPLYQQKMPPTKAAEFEVKNIRKSAEEAKADILLLLLLYSSIAIKRV